mmetsp:Transcript_48116/g.138555  ORF Transcript_48116/g.138555 Transcript_48116/m.138555 type:complete len:168 (+) Transcript_48116:78-581(+)
MAKPPAAKDPKSNGDVAAKIRSSREGSCRRFVRRRFWVLIAAAVVVVVAAAAAVLLRPQGAGAAASREPPGGDFAARPSPDSDFAKKVVRLIRKFITKRYAEYGKGAVTLRHMKQYIVDKSGGKLTYDDLRDDRYSLVIEHEVDEIVKRCDGGKRPVSCVHPEGSEL